MSIFVIFLLAIQGVYSQEVTCTEGVYYIVTSPINPGLPSFVYTMYQYSGYQVYNNLGNFDSCRKIKEAKFTVFSYIWAPALVKTFCGPVNCTEDDYYGQTESALLGLLPGYDVIFPLEYQEDQYGTYHTGPVFMLVFVSIVTAFATFATIFDYFLNNSSKSNSFIKVLLCFSVLSNGKRVLTVRGPDKNGQKDPLSLLDGVRVMSIGWVIMGHTISRYTNLAAIDNINSISDQLADFNYVPVNGAFYAVDTFF